LLAVIEFPLPGEGIVLVNNPTPDPDRESGNDGKGGSLLLVSPIDSDIP
jgi:hypothetical protein